MFLVIIVCKGPQVVKDWYRAKIAAKTWTFADLFDHFISGAVDKTAPLKDMDKYTLNGNIGGKKTELTQLSPDVSFQVKLFHAWEILLTFHCFRKKMRLKSLTLTHKQLPKSVLLKY